MSKCKKVRKKFDEINVIPFIDIMLVLLVIVLTTATFVKQGVIPVELPQSSIQSKTKKIKEIVLYVKKDGKIFFGKEKLTLEALKKKLQILSKDQVIVLKSDKNSKFQDFVSVMSLLKELQLKEFYIATQE